MDDNRFSRLENRVDEIKDDVAEVKAKQEVNAERLEDLKVHVKEYTQTVKSHVAGDDKIISEITPLIEEFKFQQERRRRRITKCKEWGIKLAIPATIIGIAAGVVKIFSVF